MAQSKPVGVDIHRFCCMKKGNNNDEENNDSDDDDIGFIEQVTFPPSGDSGMDNSQRSHNPDDYEPGDDSNEKSDEAKVSK